MVSWLDCTVATVTGFAPWRLLCVRSNPWFKDCVIFNLSHAYASVLSSTCLLSGVFTGVSVCHVYILPISNILGFVSVFYVVCVCRSYRIFCQYVIKMSMTQYLCVVLSIDIMLIWWLNSWIAHLLLYGCWNSFKNIIFHTSLDLFAACSSCIIYSSVLGVDSNHA